MGSACLALFGIGFRDLLTNVFGVQDGMPWQFWAIAAWLVITALSMFNIELSAKVIGTLSLAGDRPGTGVERQGVREWRSGGAQCERHRQLLLRFAGDRA